VAVPSTLIALIVAPTLVGLSTLAARRWGERAGGIVSAFPAIVGPVLLIVALRHGPEFAARVANGTLLGLVSLAAFALTYGRVACRRGWPVSLLAGWVSAALAGLAVGLVAAGAGSPIGLLTATVALGLAYRGLPAVPTRSEAPRPRRGTTALRMGAAVLLVAVLSASAGVLGAVAGGMLAALPVLACVLAVFTHREAGTPAVIGLLRGLLAGMASFVVFCQLIAMFTTPYGIAPALALATAVALLVQALTVCSVHSLLRRHNSAASSAVAAAPGSLARQSS
jgi:Protein of unknown function (DUF3147)